MTSTGVSAVLCPLHKHIDHFCLLPRHLFCPGLKIHFHNRFVSPVTMCVFSPLTPSLPVCFIKTPPTQRALNHRHASRLAHKNMEASGRSEESIKRNYSSNKQLFVLKEEAALFLSRRTITSRKVGAKTRLERQTKRE